MTTDTDTSWAPGATDNDSDDELIAVSSSDSLHRPRKRRKKADPEAFILKHGITRPVHVSAAVLAAWDNRLRIMMSTRENSDEFAKLRTWFDIFSMIPWGVRSTPPAVPLKESMDAMDRAIYGHDEAKGLFTAMLAKQKVNPSAKGSAIALCGPPGVGKTEFIHNCMGPVMNRPVYSIPLGGMADGTLLKGHQETYIGATCGMIVQGIISSKCMDPIFFFDELDKVSETAAGYEIITTLIHLTDSTQNHEWRDQYFRGIPFDLSRATFVFSCNDLGKVNRILADRMHMVIMNDYAQDEKAIIAERHLIGPILRDYCLEGKHRFTKEAIEYVVARTSDHGTGMRSIKKLLDRIVSKVNVMIQLGSMLPESIDSATVEAILGQK
jgi:ATP-dependent Lon protease